MQRHRLFVMPGVREAEYPNQGSVHEVVGPPNTKSLVMIDRLKSAHLLRLES